MATFKDRIGGATYPPTGERIDAALATMLEADQPRDRDGITNWNEEHGVRALLFEIDMPKLLRRMGARRHGFARELYKGNIIAVENMAKAVTGRRLAVTNGSYVALVPAGTKAGDMVCILRGARVPFLWRRDCNRYVLIGDCYVHGMMLGEMFRGGVEEPEMQEIVIR